jgi:hypothetical protein
MKTLYLSFVLFLLLNEMIINAIPIPTRCALQMNNLYANLNPPGVREVVNFTTGSVNGTSFVTASLEFQKQSRNYLIDFFGNDTAANLQFSSYISIDKPWCATDITITCAVRKIYGLRKTGSCTALIDRDKAPPSSDEVAGRIFIYPDQSPPCNGTATVTFFNTTLLLDIIGEYTYDIDGLVNNNSKTESVAISTYKGASCPFSDGSPLDALSQTQFRCLERRIGCSISRPNSNSSISIAPIVLPRTRCIGDVLGNDNIPEVVWQIYSLEPPDGLESEFDIRFRENPAAPIAANFDGELIRPSTRRQFIAPFEDLNHILQGAFATLEYNDFPAVLDVVNPGIPPIPCICGFSIDCDEFGEIDLTTVDAPINPNNQIPIAQPQPGGMTTLGGIFTFDASASFDPDDGPEPLSFLWLQVSGPSVITIPNPMDEITNVTFSEFVDGLYLFALYVSDGQNIAANTFTVRVENGLPVADAGPYQQVLVNTTVTLNGTGSFDPDGLPQPLTYNWTQFIGFSVNITDPTSPIASFFPTNLGLYMFRLTVSDGESSRSDLTTISVVDILDIPIPPVPPPTPPTTGAMPPPRVPPAPIPVLPVPPLEEPFPDLPPIPEPGVPPPVNDTFPPLFPELPPPTTTELIIIGVVFAVLCLFAWFFCYLILYTYAYEEIAYLNMKEINFYSY